MQPITRLFFASALLVWTTAALGANADIQAREQWHGAIQNGYESLATETEQLASAAVGYCNAPTSGSRPALNDAWLDAFLAWQRVRFVDFGPVENNNLSWQFQFWPDPKNLVARKARYLLGTEAPVNADVINQSGVAVQGFPMAEYLLFDEQLNSGENALPAAKNCEVLSAVTRHMARNARDLADSWVSFKQHYLDTGPYRDTTIKAGMTALEILEERRLAQPMGLRGNGKRNPYITDAWRSGKSLMAVEATVTGLEKFYLPGLTTLLKATGEAELADRIQRQFEKVADNFPEAHVAMTTLMGSDDQFRILQGLYVDVSQLSTLINDEAAVALGVVRGFNSSDGD
jgi:predicted lipoprotein